MVLKVTQPATFSSDACRRILVRCSRLQAMKRRWRGVAEDGREFVFELEQPLVHGSVAWIEAGIAYVIEVEPEPLLEISLDVAPSAAAGIGWAVGNMHLELMSEPARLLTPDEPAARQLLDRISVPYQTVVDRFRPGRFARGPRNPTHELGSSHRH
ncbi:MAG: urease accessory protein UreE [Opitutaceae bacterium]|nr:urease accessory protein UreE [Opitutaceae bacterium]